MRRYEAMFLFDGGSDWAVVDREVRRLLERIGAEPHVVIKYDDRRLAYEIKKRKRGSYALAYFEADPARLPELDRDARLSETILRHMVLDGRGVTDERINELKALPADKPLYPGQDGRRRDDDGGGPPRDDRRRRDEPRGMPPETPDLEVDAVDIDAVDAR